MNEAVSPTALQTYFDDLLRRRKDDIIERGTDWIVQASVDLKGSRPRSETRALVSMEFEAYRDELLHRDAGKRDAFIEHVTALRAASEFRISTLLRGFLSFKRGIEELLPSESLSPGFELAVRQALDRLYCETIFVMADVYASKLHDALRNTQKELMHREKMAALGGLVAGIAHEINTPMGIAVTAGSLLHDKTREVVQAFGKGELKRSTLTGFLTDSEQATALLLSNLNRAAELVHSFKQVAVDQSHDVRRRVRLGQYLSEILVSLGPLYKRTAHTIELRVVSEIEDEVFAGALAQIVSNLVHNAIQHAFSDEKPGRLDITLRKTDKAEAEIVFADNGKGMTAQERSRIFEPFFTTRRAQGGSGLGMHIVSNLTTERLGGTIAVQSEPGQGTQITLRFPIRSRLAEGK